MNRPDLKITLVIMLIIAGVLAYINTFNTPFVFDDGPNILENPHVRSLWPLNRAMSAPARSGASGRPILCLSLALNYAVSGYSVWSYHLFNLVVHILAGLTLYGIIRRTLMCERLRERFGNYAAVLAWAAAAIWMVHPIQTESVTYIIQRTESLMGLFYLLTMYSTIRAIQSQQHFVWSAVSVLCCGLGMATKEVMATAPLLVLLYDRMFGAGSFELALRRRWGLYAALAVTWAILIPLVWSEPRLQIASLRIRTGPFDYALNQGAVIIHYLRLVLWPKGLCLDYNWPVSRNWPALAPPTLAVLSLVAVTIWGIFRNSIWAYPLAWFFGVLAVTSSFVPVSDLAFEHRMYLSLAGPVVLVVLMCYILLEKLSKRFWGNLGFAVNQNGSRFASRLGIVLLALVTVTLIWVTLRRNSDYRSVETIWQAVLAVVPDNSRGHNNLGAALNSQGRVDDAMRHYRRAIELNPRDEMAYDNLGIAFQSLGRLDEAAGYYLQALRINPNDAKAHNNLGIVLKTQGNLDEAINHFRQALQIRPDFADVHYNFGNALKAQGNFDQALLHFNEALRLKPDFPEAHNNLATLLVAQGDYDRAVDHFRRALKIQPDFLPALKGLSLVLITHPDPNIAGPDEAIKLAGRATELTGRKDIVSLELLATAYAQAGQFSKAVDHEQAALELASAAKDGNLTHRISEQLEIYKQKITPPNIPKSP